jgi:hypothetical protein
MIQLRILALVLGLGLALTAVAQPRPYIGFVYPAGGQRGTTFQIRLGGQGLDEVNAVILTGTGMSARIVEYYWRLETEELQLLNEQVADLRGATMSDSARAMLKEARDPAMTADASAMTTGAPTEVALDPTTKQEARKLIDRIERRTSAFVVAPACEAIASLVMAEITIAPDAPPGEREIRLVTRRGVSNPLAFHVGQFPELSQAPMYTSSLEVLGKEAQALRHRAAADGQDPIRVPCTVNGQIAPGEIHRYRFEAHKGQRLVINTLGRQLVPFIADAVPGWFQPVLALYDADGKEVAYQDDYRFKPDPIILYEVPKDAALVLAIHDSLYRGREDFVYRITIGELPFITSVFPLGGPTDSRAKPEMTGWNLENAELQMPPADYPPGFHSLRAIRQGFLSNPVRFALSQLPEVAEQEPNDTIAKCQRVTLPVIINGRIGRPDDWDVFEFAGHSNDTVVAEVQARRLDSPLDSFLKLTDSAGKVLAFNDDHEDLAAALSTHQADSYLVASLPADGSFYLHIGDTARHGGAEYGYRLRISSPRQDFELRVVPSSVALASRSNATLTVYAQRKDGFAGPITVNLKDAPRGFSAPPLILSATQSVAELMLKTDLISTPEPVDLSIHGTASIGGRETVRRAVPAEDRMQAFLWRQLVPASDLKALVFDPGYQPPPSRLAHAGRTSTNAAAAVTSVQIPTATNAVAGTNAPAAAKPKFTPQQAVARLRLLQRLFEAGLLTDELYNEKVAECETSAL